MQQINRDTLISKASELLNNGTVSAILGWKKGEFCYDITPAVFNSLEDLQNDFVWGDFCGSNLSKYLIKEADKAEGKILVFLKPCDTYSFNQLLTEHRFNREKVYVVAIPCNGMCDTEKIKHIVNDTILGISSDDSKVTVSTLVSGDVEISMEDALLERCTNCKSKKSVAYDELLNEDGEVLDSNRFDMVEKLEAMTEDERFAFWQNELSKCIRCNACRNVCPACSCENCVFDNPNSGVQNKAAADSFEEKMFHIIRAFHVAGRCTDCGECSRVCPQGIPLHLLNRKFIKDINEFYGDYQAGSEVGSRAPLVNFTFDDIEAADVLKKGEDK